MVNVWDASRSLHNLPASLTGVVVPNTGSTSQRAPVRTVIAGITAAPGRVIHTFAIVVAAIQRTERHTAFAFAPALVVIEINAAVQTGGRTDDSTTPRLASCRNLRRFSFGSVTVRCRHNALSSTCRTARVMAGSRAELPTVLAFDCRRRSLKRIPARSTCQGYARFQDRSPKGIRASATTCRLPPVPQSIGIRLVPLPTNRTVSRDRFHTMNYSARVGQ